MRGAGGKTGRGHRAAGDVDPILGPGGTPQSLLISSGDDKAKVS